MTALKVSPANKIAYGIGSVAFGIKGNGFDYFLLLFYSQVLGVDAYLVGLALLIALMVDSLSDPLIGYFSDNTHTRWGRRHPYMYIAAIPVALSYFFVWNPPSGVSGNDLFPYILMMAIFVRTMITLYEIPNSALVAEITDDYDERTSILSYRYFFGWAGGTLMGFYALTYLLVPTTEISNGLFNIAGYGKMGLASSIVIFTAIITSAMGTHSFIPKLKTPPPKTRMSITRIYREIFETLWNRSFGALFAAALFGAIGTGIATGLSHYINSFFWGFSTVQLGQISGSVVASAVIALILSPIISKKLGKKRSAITIGLLAFTILPATIVLRLLGFMPENGDPLLFPMILVITIVDVGLIITYQIITTSMIADLVEESELRTGRRSEGVFFATMTFVKKFVQGFGVVMATTILTFAQFPVGVAPGSVPADTLFRLGALYVPAVVTVWMLMIVCISYYEVDRDKHKANLAALGRT
ncbi:MAG: MFS transporter [Porticoccaceae bacterium]|tara:strand:- start:656 stop:2071 length:1416 start_codon:yes stop_codon:yes gene_type:complete